MTRSLWIARGPAAAAALALATLAGLPAAAQMVVPPPPIGMPGGPAAVPPPFLTSPEQGFIHHGESAAAANPPSAQATEAGDCATASGVAEAATQPQGGSGDARTDDEGATGWTGGTGGTQIGTNPQGAVAVSKTWQPPTARGLDLKGVPDAVVQPASATAPPKC